MRLKAKNGGKFVFSGFGEHVSRVISSWELIFVIKGNLSMFIGEDTYNLSANQGLLLPIDVRHGGNGKYTPGLSFFWLHFYPRNKQSTRQLWRTHRYFNVAYPARLSEYFQCFLSLQDDFPEDETGLDLLANLIVHEALRNNPATKTVNLKQPQLVEKLKNMLTLHFREPLSTSTLAKELKCTPDYLERLWRCHSGESITGSLNAIRIEQASKLLKHSTLSIAEIAYEVGFNDLAYFRRRFFRIHAMKPSHYRKLNIRGLVNTE